MVARVFVGALALSACTSTTDSAVVPATPSQRSAAGQQRSPARTPDASTPAPSTTVEVTTTDVTTTTVVDATTTVRPSTSTSVATTTATTTIPELDVYNPSCVVEADAPGSLDQLDVGETDLDVSGFDLWAENDFLGRALVAGDLVDVCLDNQVDDVSGEPRIGRNDPIVALAVFDDVKRQQEKLNQLFGSFAIAELDVDGVSGPQTGLRRLSDREAGSQPRYQEFCAERGLFVRECRGDTSTTSTPGRATVAVWNADALVSGLRRWKQMSRAAQMRIAPGHGRRRRPAEFGRFDSIPASTGRCSGNTSPTRGCLPGLSRLTRRSRA